MIFKNVQKVGKEKITDKNNIMFHHRLKNITGLLAIFLEVIKTYGIHRIH